MLPALMLSLEADLAPRVQLGEIAQASILQLVFRVHQGPTLDLPQVSQRATHVQLVIRAHHR